MATVPSLFIPAAPPTPVAPSSLHVPLSLMEQLHLLTRNVNFWVLFTLFSIYVGFFNALSSVLTQVLTPYGYSETQAGIAGALLIVVGLVTAAVLSPIIDRSKRYLLLIKTMVPILGTCYLVFIWAPAANTIAASYIVCSCLGAASFSLVPVALEWLAEVTYPVGPEVSSVLCWTGGQLLGGLFIIVLDALQEGPEASPPWNLHRGLIFEGVLAVIVIPIVFLLGWIKPAEKGRSKADESAKTDFHESEIF